MSNADLKYTSVYSASVMFKYPQQSAFAFIYTGFWQLGNKNLGILTSTDKLKNIFCLKF